jgi:hypothetical protein
MTRRDSGDDFCEKPERMEVEDRTIWIIQWGELYMMDGLYEPRGYEICLFWDTTFEMRLQNAQNYTNKDTKCKHGVGKVSFQSSRFRLGASPCHLNR